MDGTGAGYGLLARPAMVGVVGTVDHGAVGGFGSGFGAATCNGCSPSTTTSSSTSSSLGSNSSCSGGSSSSSTTSSDFMDDATSPSDRLSPLCEMAALMADLPIKRGLSRHFQGKSQSFASLAAVASVQDLAKPARGPWRQRSRKGNLKACKSRSYAAGLDNGHGHAPPISPNGRAIAKPKKHYSCCGACRRNNAGGGGFWVAAAAAAAAGRLPPFHAHHQRHGAAGDGSCVGRHALLFA